MGDVPVLEAFPGVMTGPYSPMLTLPYSFYRKGVICMPLFE